MKHAETVTFGGAGRERFAELRGQSSALARQAGAVAIVFWRGKPLVDSASGGLVRLATLHPLIAAGIDQAIYLGQVDDNHIFAADISDWEPNGQDVDGLNTFLDPSQQQHPNLTEGQVFCELRAVMTRLDAQDAELAATARAMLGWHETHQFCARCGAASQMAMGGWQRDCAACGGHHFPRTDPVVIMLITAGDQVLMGRSPGWPEGMYSLLAGFIEPGETVEAAVRREVFEEAGVRVGAVRYLASQPWPFPASLMLGCAGDALTTEIALDPTEIEDALWVSRADMQVVFDGQHPLIKPARKGAIAHFLLENWLLNRLD